MSSYTDNTEISGNNLGGIDVTIDGVTFHNYEGPPTQDAFSYIINPNTTYLDTSFNFVETKNVYIILIFTPLFLTQVYLIPSFV